MTALRSPRQPTEPVPGHADGLGELGEDDPGGVQASIRRRPAATQGVVTADPPVEDQIAAQEGEADPPGRPGRAEGHDRDNDAPEDRAPRVGRTKCRSGVWPYMADPSA